MASLLAWLGEPRYLCKILTERMWRLQGPLVNFAVLASENESVSFSDEGDIRAIWNVRQAEKDAFCPVCLM